VPVLAERLRDTHLADMVYDVELDHVTVTAGLQGSAAILLSAALAALPALLLPHAYCMHLRWLPT
jgi:hypothetical protein